MFKNPFSFNGRIRRLEYCLSYLIYFFIISCIPHGTWPFGDTFRVVISVFIYMLSTGFLFAQGVKRSHDVGNSGWFILMPFYHLWMLFADGDIGDNEYGENPKGWDYEFEDYDEEEEEVPI